MAYLHEAWLKRLDDCWSLGDRVQPRGQLTHELVGETLTVSDYRYNILHVPERHMNYRFAVAEWLWMAFGRSDVGTLARYCSKMTEYSDDGIFLAGAYGPMIRAQWPFIVKTLTDDPVSRQAVISIWKPCPQPSKDIPCTTTLQFLIRRGRLDVVATMRSSDAWLGIPYDVFSFTQLANSLAGQLGVGRGCLKLHAGSAHLYARDVEGAELVRRARGRAVVRETLPSPRLPGPPPDWLDDILVNPNCAIDPSNYDRTEKLVWTTYARALRAKTSTDALHHLRLQPMDWSI